MPLGRKHLRRSRDAPILGWTMQRTSSRLGGKGREVKRRWTMDSRLDRTYVEANGERQSHPKDADRVQMPSALP